MITRNNLQFKLAASDLDADIIYVDGNAIEAVRQGSRSDVSTIYLSSGSFDVVGSVRNVLLLAGFALDDEA